MITDDPPIGAEYTMTEDEIHEALGAMMYPALREAERAAEEDKQ